MSLLQTTLTVLQEIPQIQQKIVVSRDPVVLQFATDFGANGVLETTRLSGKQTGDYRLNQAVAMGVEKGVEEMGELDGVLILPADLPFITSEDIAEFIAGNIPNQMSICPDRHYAGTNALLLNPPQPFTFHFGANSFLNHFQEATTQGLNSLFLPMPNLQFDLDTEADWHEYHHVQPNHSHLIPN